MIKNKIGMCIVYFAIGRIVYWITGILGFGNINGGNGYTYSQILIIGIVICACSYYLRDGKLRKEHKGDDSVEKSIFNSSLKEKIFFILKTSDFKIETIIHVIVSLVIIMIPLIESAIAYSFSAVFAIKSTIIMLVLWMIFMPIYMTILNVISWLMAYNKCYKRKEF